MKIQSIAHYTRFVNFTKLLLIILVVILTSAILFYPVFKKNSGIRIALVGNTSKNTPPPTQMLNANFHGFDENNQPYNITAKTALQMDQNNVTFDQLNADITLRSGEWISTQADKGSLKMKEHLLYLNGKVQLFTDEGYEMHTDSMLIDLEKKFSVTEDTVTGQGPFGTIKSNGAVFDSTAKVATFNGPVFVTIRLPPKQDKPK